MSANRNHADPKLKPEVGDIVQGGGDNFLPTETPTGVRQAIRRRAARNKKLGQRTLVDVVTEAINPRGRP